MTQNIIDYLNQLPYFFYFLAIDEHLDIQLPKLKNFLSLNPKNLNIVLDQKNSGRLLSHPATIEYIKKHTPTNLTPAIIPFKPSAKIDIICQQNNWKLIANPSHLNRHFEDKLKFISLLQEAKISHIPFILTTFNRQNFENAITRFDSPLVIQTHFGWAGNSSYLSSSFGDSSPKIPIDTPIKISPFLPGDSLINNCCLYNQSLIQSPTGLQFTGIKALTNNPLATVGRQWPAHLSSELEDQVTTITTQFTKILQDSNYRGFFGLDFLHSQGKIYLLECNPRLTASYAFYTRLEENQSLVPMFYYHLLSFLDSNYPLPTDDRRLSTLIGAELTKKDLQGATIAKSQHFLDLAPTNNTLEIDSQYFPNES